MLHACQSAIDTTHHLHPPLPHTPTPTKRHTVLANAQTFRFTDSAAAGPSTSQVQRGSVHCSLPLRQEKGPPPPPPPHSTSQGSSSNSNSNAAAARANGRTTTTIGSTTKSSSSGSGSGGGKGGSGGVVVGRVVYRLEFPDAVEYRIFKVSGCGWKGGGWGVRLLLLLLLLNGPSTNQPMDQPTPINRH
jgi:hypothetical protein